MDQDVRWKQRFQNYERAVRLLSDPLQFGTADLSDLEMEGVVHRFEYALELAWKTLKDYMEQDGIVIAPVTPRNVIKLAFNSKIIGDGQVWIDMLEHRNLLSHTYDQQVFKAVGEALVNRYLAAFDQMRIWFSERLQ